MDGEFMEKMLKDLAIGLVIVGAAIGLLTAGIIWLLVSIFN